MKNFWSKFNELIFSPIAILVFAAAYYAVYRFFGPEAGLIPPGYFTNVLAGAAIMYIAGFMATFALRMNFYHYYAQLFEPELMKIVLSRRKVETPGIHIEILSLCVYFAFYALSIWALTSML